MTLFEAKYMSGSSGNDNQIQYDVSADGQSFIMLRPLEERPQNEIKVVLNWSRELERLVPTR